jgi:hypothetical protein
MRSSARLIILPGQRPGPPAPPIKRTKQPGGPRMLSEVILEEDEVLVDGFEAVLNGVKVRVTAVLERTCVYVGKDGDRRLARKKDLIVEADKLPIRIRGLG